MLLLLMLTSIAASAQETCAVFTEGDSTLAFYYDELRNTRPGISYSLNTGDNDPDWSGNYGEVSQVVFDCSFAAARPTTTRSWFRYMERLTSITGINYLNTENVKFMGTMFNGCSHLETIYAGKGGSTSSVTYSDRMFYGCTNLVGGQGTTYNKNFVDAARAHIDGGPSNPGYLTEGVDLLPGDVNSDGEVNIADVNAVIACILTGSGVRQI